MRVVNSNKIQNVVSEIKFLLSSCEQYLKQLRETCNELQVDYNQLISYENQKVLGSNRVEETKERIQYFYQKYHITGANNVPSLISTIEKEIENLNQIGDKIMTILVTMNDSAIIIAIYIKNIEEMLSNNTISFKEKLQLASNLMKNDENGIYLYNTPILEEGELELHLYDTTRNYKGKYLKFYNLMGIPIYAPLVKIQKDKKGNTIFQMMTEEEEKNFIFSSSRYHSAIMNEMKNYGKHFQEKSSRDLKSLNLIYFDYDKTSNDKINWVAYTEADKFIVVDMKVAMESEECYQFQLDSFSHELGHAYDYETGNFFEQNILREHHISNTKEWQEIFQQLTEQDGTTQEYLSGYAYSSPQECFSECVTEYYKTPQDLKQLKVDIEGYDNMYEYMGKFLN